MPDAPATTLSSAAYARLRRDILQGALPPGQKLRIEEACARTGTTSTPVREAIAHRTQAWEEALVLAFHRLARTERSIEVATFRENPDLEQTHGAFHQALIATCPSRFLIDFCRRLSDHAVR